MKNAVHQFELLSIYNYRNRLYDKDFAYESFLDELLRESAPNTAEIEPGGSYLPN